MKTASVVTCCLLSFCILSFMGCKSDRLDSPPQKAVQQQNRHSETPKQTPSIIGKWVTDVPNAQGGAPGKITITYKPDGIQEQVVEGNGRVATLRATYSIEKDILTQSLISAQEKGQEIPLPNSGPKAFVIKVEQDKLSITPRDIAGDVVVLTRVKE